MLIFRNNIILINNILYLFMYPSIYVSIQLINFYFVYFYYWINSIINHSFINESRRKGCLELLNYEEKKIKIIYKYILFINNIHLLIIYY